ncbi:excalibur calcium-binding domain-containing protein [Streptomyces sp. NPDC002851]
MSRTLFACCAFLLAGTVAVASGCGSSGEEDAGTPVPTVTTTRTVTSEPTPSSTPPKTTPPDTTPPETTAVPTRDAAATVEAYFAAINARDYRRAWELGGKNLGGSYESFKAGFADTVHDTVHIVDVRGGTVMVTLDALQTDGSVRSFEGTYRVRNGVIVDADIRRSTQPTAPDEPTRSYPPGPPAGVPDVDCSDLSGPVWVGPSDPHRLDDDGDGIGCDLN